MKIMSRSRSIGRVCMGTESHPTMTSKRSILAAAAIAALSTQALATDVTLRLVDQNGAPIAASQFDFGITGVPVVQQGGTVALSPGVHALRVFPGMNGFSQGSTLYREDTITVAGVTQAIDLVWRTAALLANVIDQDNVVITASRLDVRSVTGGVIVAGTAITLPVTDNSQSTTILGELAGGYSVRALPGIFGFQADALYREHGPFELSDAGLDIDLVWPRATTTISVVDQNASPIAASMVDVRHSSGGLTGGLFTLPATLQLPVTDDPGGPSIQGELAPGYVFRALPGILGFPSTANGGPISRDHGPIEIGATSDLVSLTWPTAPLAINVLDQDLNPIPASRFHLWQSMTGGLAGAIFPTGTTMILPVTDDPTGPAIQGALADGYLARLMPGINGVQQGDQLLRVDGAEELTIAGAVRDLIWEVAHGTLHVVDASEHEVSGASLLSPFTGVVPSGTIVSFPLNDNALYPSLQGASASAYSFSIRLTPAGAWSGPFLFEMMAGRAISPAFVTIGGASYGLRFEVQPIADLDGDGYAEPEDCDDTDPTIHPGAPDLPGDTVDQDCDGVLSCDPNGVWRNHGHFVSSVAAAANDLVNRGLITRQLADDIISTAARSDVGKKK